MSCTRWGRSSVVGESGKVGANAWSFPSTALPLKSPVMRSGRFRAYATAWRSSWLENGCSSVRIWSVRYCVEGFSRMVMFASEKSACDPWYGVSTIASMAPAWSAATCGALSEKYFITRPSRYGMPFAQ